MLDVEGLADLEREVAWLTASSARAASRWSASRATSSSAADVVAERLGEGGARVAIRLRAAAASSEQHG